MHGSVLSSFAKPFQPSETIVGLAPLLKQAFHGVDISPQAQRWIERAKTHKDASALLDLSITLELQRKPEIAMAIQGDALRRAQHYRVATQATEIALRLLVIKSPGDLTANTPIECLLENANIAIELLYVAEDMPLPKVLPEHDLLFVAVAESVENRPILEGLQGR